MASEIAVSILIPTFRRPERALAAALSALAQAGAPAFELVLIDNDPAGSALSDLRALGARSNVPVIVVHEPSAGVANARNAGLRAARGAMIAFLDDDEIAPSGWLAELVRVQRAWIADVVFGPVHTKLAGTPRDHAAFFDAFFSREPRHEEGMIDAIYGCGCSLIRRAALSTSDPFSPERNEIGGEDDLLFQSMHRDGRRFAWAPGAWVWETPEPSRVTLRYTLLRAFAYGQGPGMREWSTHPRSWIGAAGWMAVGAGQMLVYGPLALLAFAARHPRRAFAYRRFVESLGKIFWFPVLNIRFYGDAQIARPAPRRALLKSA